MCTVVLNLTTNFFLGWIFYLFFCSLIQHSWCAAQTIWNIYQGIACWRHSFNIIMLLAFEITLCNGGQNNLSVETVFKSTSSRHKFVYLLACTEQWIWCLWWQNAVSKLRNVALKDEAPWREILFSPVFVGKSILESLHYFLIISPLMVFCCVDLMCACLDWFPSFSRLAIVQNKRVVSQLLLVFLLIFQPGPILLFQASKWTNKQKPGPDWTVR